MRTSLFLNGQKFQEFELSVVPPKIKVKMPPLGEGLMKLKELFDDRYQDK